MLGSTGATPSTDAEAPAYYAAHWRWLETDDKLPSPAPIQGRWSIRGLALSEATLDRIYRKNAETLFGPPPAASESADAFPPYFRVP